MFEEVLGRVEEFFVESGRLVAEGQGGEKGEEQTGNEVKMLVEAFTVQALSSI